MTSRVTRASTRSSSRADSLDSERSTCRPMTDDAGTTTSTNRGSGGAGATSGNRAGSGDAAGSAAAAVRALSRPVGAEGAGLEFEAEVLTGVADSAVLLPDAGRLSWRAAGGASLAVRAATLVGASRFVGRSGAGAGGVTGCGAGSGASAGFAAGADAGGVTTPSVSVTGWAAGVDAAAGWAETAAAAGRSAAFC